MQIHKIHKTVLYRISIPVHISATFRGNVMYTGDVLQLYIINYNTTTIDM